MKCFETARLKQKIQSKKWRYLILKNSKTLTDKENPIVKIQGKVAYLFS